MLSFRFCNGIKSLTAQESRQLLKIENDSYDYPWEYEDFSDISIIAAIENNCIIGYCVYNYTDIRTISIQSVTVSEKNRRKGIATKLIEQAMLVSNASMITTQTIADNLQAQLLFKKFGFICNRTSYQYYYVDSRSEELEMETYHFVFRKSWSMQEAYAT